MLPPPPKAREKKVHYFGGKCGKKVDTVARGGSDDVLNAVA